MVKLNCINQQACIINYNHETNTIKHEFKSRLGPY